MVVRLELENVPNHLVYLTPMGRISTLVVNVFLYTHLVEPLGLEFRWLHRGLLVMIGHRCKVVRTWQIR